jgi:3-oxoacyl-[acyl-carrier protein] reductase
MAHDYLIVTGGSRGIGYETMAYFIDKGWHAINISRSPSLFEKATNIQIDLSQATWPAEQITKLINTIKNATRLCLVHNAAVYKQDNINSLTDNDLRAVLELNLIAAVKLNHLLLPYMKAQSAIIYIGSTVSELGVANRASYVISKHATLGLMRATCQDLVGSNIMTCCICPGFVNTQMLTNETDKETLAHFVKQKVSFGRLIEPREIADLIYYAANQPILNGAVLHANLGQITN